MLYMIMVQICFINSVTYEYSTYLDYLKVTGIRPLAHVQNSVSLEADAT